MSITEDARPTDTGTSVEASTVDVDAAERRARARASIAVGRERGYYRVLFESGPVDAAAFAELAGVPEQRAHAWLAEQFDAGLLRAVPSPDGDREELLLPGEYVPILLGDHGEPELVGARGLLAEHRHELPRILDDLRPARHHLEGASEAAPLGLEVERARAFSDAARLARVV